MPTYEIQTPDGRTFEIDSPTPPTEADMETITGSAPSSPNLTAMDWGGAALGGAALLGLGALARNKGMLGQGFNKLNALRQQLMLTGFALPKSLLGNVGATVARSAETRSMEPLKQLFSRQTLRDAGAAYKANAGVGPHAGGTFPGPNPGRIMGAFDTATRNALQRSGDIRYTPLNADDAATAVFQAPLGQNFGPFAKALESPAARVAFPFRRTPYNQFYEGLKTLQPGFEHGGVRNAYMGVGALHGMATEDEQYPLTLPLGVAAAARYGLPYGAAAIAGRFLGGGKTGGGVAGSVLPTSEWGLEQTLQNPTRPFYDPAALNALQRLGF